MAVLEHDDVALRPFRVSPGRLRTRRGPSWRQVLRWALTAVAVAIVVGNWWLSQRQNQVTPEPGSALAALEALPVREPLPDDAAQSGYTREAFGPAWADVDGNSCSTRDDVLARDLSDVVRSGSCTVTSGVLEDPYTGTEIPFTRGVDTSGAVQIDHVVALEDAWRTGASTWDATTRERFANDPLNLLASDGPANMGKGSRDASHWLPPSAAYRCEYVARQVAVKKAYHLAVSFTEHQAMADVLGTCPAEPLPVR